MSFHDKYQWLPRDPDCLSDDKKGLGTCCDDRQKQQAPRDAPEREIFCSRKKQAVESMEHRPIPRNACATNVVWDNGSKSQPTSTQLGSLFFGPESFSPLEFADQSISSGGDKSQNVEKIDSLQQFGNEPAVNLSMSHNMEDSSSLNSGVGIANISQVGNTANSFTISMGNGLGYIAAENSQLALGTSFQGSHNNLFQPAYQREDEYYVSHRQSSSLSYVNLISNGQALAKSPNEFVRLDQLSGAHVSPALSDAFEAQANYSFLSSAPYNKEHDNLVMDAPPFGNTVSSFNSTNLSFDMRDAVTTTPPSNYKENVTPTSVGISYDAGSSSILSMNQRYDDAEGTIISFGLEAKDSSCGVISSPDILLSQSVMQDTEPLVHKVYPEPVVNQGLNIAPTNKTSGAPKKVESKKVQANNFPSNVKSLLSTGILDGVPVKYVALSKERNLRGIIKGTGYLCGCSDCLLSKVVNAYEFERHAGCKTKHPNNHIYFENGKTIYSVVQELKSTPQELLFEVIQNVSGSPINQKNFRIWKVSYQAATRELARIYGKDETPVLS